MSQAGHRPPAVEGRGRTAEGRPEGRDGTPPEGWDGITSHPGPSVARAGRRVAFALPAASALVGVARAHGAGSGGGGHLVADLVGLFVALSLGYLLVAFARRVLYPRLREALSR